MSSGTRKRAILIAALALCGVAGLSSAHALTTPGARAEHARLRDYFSERDIARSRSYWRTGYPLRLATIAVGVLALAAVTFGPVSRWVRDVAGHTSGGRWWATTALVAVLVVVIISLVQLPLDIARLSHDRKFGLSTQSTAGYLGDAGKGLFVQVVIAAIAAVGFVAIARWFPRRWPGVAAVGGITLVVLLVFVAPAVLEPLFNKFTPVDPALRRRIIALADRSGVKVDRVLVADASRRTTAQNAYVSGLGSTKRVVLFDTLLARSSPAEVDLVVAHELGHVAHHDDLKGSGYAAAGAAAAVVLLWLLLSSSGVRAWARVGGASDPFVVPFAAMVLAAASVVVMPAANWASRRIEAAADRTAIELTGDPRTFVRTEISLAKSNLSDLQPNRAAVWWFFSHPPVLDRIQIALDAERGRGA